MGFFVYGMMVRFIYGAIPTNIKKEHILKAIKRFEEEGLPDKNAKSQYYDLFYKDKRYPPKVIFSTF